MVIITGLTNQYLSHLDNPILEWGDCNVSGFSDPVEGCGPHSLYGAHGNVIRGLAESIITRAAALY